MAKKPRRKASFSLGTPVCRRGLYLEIKRIGATLGHPFSEMVWTAMDVFYASDIEGLQRMILAGYECGRIEYPTCYSHDTFYGIMKGEIATHPLDVVKIRWGITRVQMIRLMYDFILHECAE